MKSKFQVSSLNHRPSNNMFNFFITVTIENCKIEKPSAEVNI